MEELDNTGSFAGFAAGVFLMFAILILAGAWPVMATLGLLGLTLGYWQTVVGLLAVWTVGRLLRPLLPVSQQ